MEKLPTTKAGFLALFESLKESGAVSGKRKKKRAPRDRRLPLPTPALSWKFGDEAAALEFAEALLQQAEQAGAAAFLANQCRDRAAAAPPEEAAALLEEARGWDEIVFTIRPRWLETMRELIGRATRDAEREHKVIMTRRRAGNETRKIFVETCKRIDAAGLERTPKNVRILWPLGVAKPVESRIRELLAEPDDKAADI